MIKRVFIIWLISVISACSQWNHPNPHIAKIAPKQWPHQNHQVTDTAANLPELAWWEQYDDPVLNQLMTRTLLENNQLKVAMSNVEYAQAELKQIQLNWIPGVNILGGYSQMPTLGDPQNFIGVIPMFAMNVFKQIKEQERAEYLIQASQYTKDSVRLALIGQVSGSYFAVLAQQQALELYKILLDDNQRLLRLYHKQYDAALIPYDDISLLESNIAQIEAQIAITEHNIAVSKNALHYLLNENPGDLPISNSFNRINSNKIIPGNLPATVLNNRPDVKQASFALKAANANIGVAASDFLPSIRLDAFLNYRSSINGYQHLLEATSDIPLITPTTLGKLDARQASYKAAYNQYMDVIRGVLRDVDNDLSAYNAYSRQLNQVETALLREKQRCHFVNVRYKNGLENALGVTQCQIRIDQLALQINQNKFEKMMTIVTLYQDLGGGYTHGIAETRT